MFILRHKRLWTNLRKNAEEVNGAYSAAAAGEMQGILDITMGEYISSDILGNLHSSISSIIGGLSTAVVGDRMVKVLAWYDNEYGYLQRLLELADFVADKMEA